MASLVSNLTINTDDDWQTIISNIANGIYQRIGGGSFKQVYRGPDNKVYATEQIVTNNATFLFHRLKNIRKRVEKHVLIPDRYVERDGTRYWEMDHCQADLDAATGKTGGILKTFTMAELLVNFVELEKTVSDLHDAGITAMDIKPANMLFICAEGDRSIQMTDLDGSRIDGMGKANLTLYFTYLKFEENYIKQDLFALYTSFLRIIDESLWDYVPLKWYRTMKDWTDDVISKLDSREDFQADLVRIYLNKLNALEPTEKRSSIMVAHSSVEDIFGLRSVAMQQSFIKNTANRYIYKL